MIYIYVVCVLIICFLFIMCFREFSKNISLLEEKVDKLKKSNTFWEHKLQDDFRNNANCCKESAEMFMGRMLQLSKRIAKLEKHDG